MKKIFYAMAIALLFAACARNIDVPADNEIKVQFEIAEKGDFGADTKAVKTGWEMGDQIWVVLSDDPAGTDYVLAKPINFLRWENKSGKPIWKCSTDNLGSLQDYNESGVYKAIYYVGSVNWGEVSAFGVTLPDYKGGEFLVAEGDYQIVDDVLVLGTINMTRPENLIQISVKDLGSKKGTWTLSVEGIVQGNELTDLNHLASGSIDLDSQINVQVSRFSSVNAQGVKCGDDVAFCFLAGSNPGTRNYTFTLSDGGQTYTYNNVIKSIGKGKAYRLPPLTSGLWSATIQ